MIDAIQIPILLKAIDFIFDEGRKILDERRERRKTDPARGEIQEPPKEVTPPAPEPKQDSAPKPVFDPKQELLTSKIDEILWRDHETEVQHLVRLLETYSRNYHLAKEQYAKWGSALVPPIIINNMSDAENSMIETIKQLEAVLSKIYKKDIQPIK